MPPPPQRSAQRVACGLLSDTRTCVTHFRGDQLHARMDLRHIQITAQHADPRTKSNMAWPARTSIAVPNCILAAVTVFGT